MADEPRYEPDFDNEEDTVTVVRTLLDQAQGVLEAQTVQLDGMRTRAMQFVAFIGTATAFLLGTALNSQGLARNDTLTLLGTATAALAIGALGYLLWPKQWDSGPDVKKLLNWAETGGASHSANFLARSAMSMAQKADTQKSKLRSLTRCYTALCVFGTLQLAFWITQLFWMHR